VICTDKTGTLTKNEMTVRSFWFNGKKYLTTGVGCEPKGKILDEKEKSLSKKQEQELEIIMDTTTMACNARIHKPDKNHKTWYAIGDPTEAALITLSSKGGFWSEKKDKKNKKLQEFPFDSEIRRMSAVRKINSDIVLTTKGSTESILSISKFIYKNGKNIKMTSKQKKEIQKINEQYSEEGLRVLAIARRELKEQKDEYERDKTEKDMTFLGLMAMIDPPKEGVKKAIKECQDAHIRVFILTGDHPETAQAVGREIGIPDPGKSTPLITGTELKKMNKRKLKSVLKKNQYIIFSRVDPEDKLRIVETLGEQGEVVAVTGDGVNDAPALKKAHIGVAMGQRGNDVAKEASRLVLLDDNFSTLVNAVEEGRTIYTNLKKTVLANLTVNVAELTVVLLGMLAAALFNYPIPILAAQILAIDLLGDIGPLTMLTFDPPGKDTMTRYPRKLKEHMLNWLSGVEITFMGTVIGTLAFLNFYLFMQRNSISLTVNDVGTMYYLKATALSYCTIVFCQYVNILQRREERVSIFNKNFFSNKLLLISILLTIGLVGIIIYVPYINDFLAFGPLNITDWAFVIGSSLVYLFVFEGLKFYKRTRNNKVFN
jgi:Ca2+-transporting ATPase